MDSIWNNTCHIQLKEAMKKLKFLLLTLSLGFVSCSQCYECKHTVEIISGGQVIEEEAVEEFCTATPEELDAKEDAGFECSPV